MKETSTIQNPPVLQQGESLYLQVTSVQSPTYWLVLRLKSLSLLSAQLTERTDKKESDMLAFAIREMSEECFAVANYCDENSLFS
jgi:hypothetical protein